MRNQLRRILENSSIPLEELALDVFRETIHELGNVRHSVALSKLDKAQILTNSIDDNQLEKLYLKMSSIHESGTFHGKDYCLTGFSRVSRQRDRSLNQAPSPVSIYLKLDIVSSTELLEQWGTHFEEHATKVLRYCRDCFTGNSGELVTREGDALYFTYSGDEEGSNDLFDGALRFFSWLEVFNLFHNSLGKPLSIKFVGLSIPTHKDDQDKQTITERLTVFEKRFGRGDSLIIDENIWKHIPVNINNMVRKFYISDGMFYGMYKRFSFRNSFVREEILC